MTISYVWPTVEKQNNDFNENQQIEAFTWQLFVHLFEALHVSQTEYQLTFWSTCRQQSISNICIALWNNLEYSYLQEANSKYYRIFN